MKMIFLKTGLIASVLFFTIYILLIIVGSFSCVCGAENSFYCGFYCWFSISLFSLAGAFVLCMLVYNMYYFVKSKPQNSL